MMKRVKETFEQIQAQNPAAAPVAAAQPAAVTLGHPMVPGDNEDESNSDTPFPSLVTQETEPDNDSGTKQ